MKRSILLLGIVATALLFVLQSCKKDNDFKDIDPQDQFQGLDMKAYDEFGVELEKAVDKAIRNDEFRYLLIRETQKKEQGDYEVLMTSLLSQGLEEGGTAKDLLLENAAGLFSEKELDEFLRTYPSLIMATRGEITSWLEQTHVAPVVFLPSDFKEDQKEISVLTKGQKSNLKIDTRQLEGAVVVMHISERHDQQGNPLVHQSQASSNERPEEEPYTPSVNLSGELGAEFRTCAPEPTSCTPPVITDFDVDVSNGAVQISYEVDNFPESLCSWGRVTITRIGPDLDGDGEVDLKYFYRRASHFRTFNDVTAVPNTEYTYRISVRISYIGPNGWVTCPAASTAQETVIAPDVLPRLESFVGENISNTTLKYNWYPPNGVPVTQYRLRALVGNSYQEIPGSPFTANSNNFAFYEHPTSSRGSLVEMQVQYRTSAGIWSGDFFDRTYASFRNPNQGLHWYGVYMPNVEDYELNGPGENVLHGAPEIRLFAIQGAGSLEDRQTDEVQHLVIFTTSLCSETRERTIKIYIRPGYYIEHTIIYTVSSDYYVDVSHRPVDITTSWDNYLIGGAIKVVLTETDATEINVEDWSIEDITEKSISAEVGYKAPFGLSASVGVESSWKNAEEISYKYPISDIEMDINTIYYHNPLLNVSNKNLYGLHGDEDLEDGKITCEFLEEHLD